MGAENLRCGGRSVKQHWTRSKDSVIREHAIEDSSIVNIGPRLRALREARHLSVRSLAERTGFSPSFVSQVELGQSSPSLASLQRICTALDIHITDLFRDGHETNGVPVLRRRDRAALRSEWSKASAESLLPQGGDESMAALLLVLDAGGRTGAVARRRGWRDLAYCARGRVALFHRDERCVLGPGDSALLEGAGAASWENLGRSRAEVLIVSTRVR